MKTRLTPDQVNRIVARLVPIIKSNCRRFELVGSSRRGKDTIGDIDFIVANADIKGIADSLPSIFPIKQTLRQGSVLASFIIDVDGQDVQLEFSNVDLDAFGAALVHATGNNNLNIALRSIAKKKGYLLNQYGLFNRDSNELIVGDTEAKIFNALGYKFIPKTKRAPDSVPEAFDLLRMYQLKVNEESTVTRVLQLLESLEVAGEEDGTVSQLGAVPQGPICNKKKGKQIMVKTKARDLLERISPVANPSKLSDALNLMKSNKFQLVKSEGTIEYTFVDGNNDMVTFNADGRGKVTYWLYSPGVDENKQSGDSLESLAEMLENRNEQGH